jgi:hypothetical protein
MVELGVLGSSSTGGNRLLGIGVSGGLSEERSSCATGMNRGLALVLGLLFVGVAEVFCELPRDDAESLRNTTMASFRVSAGERVSAEKGFGPVGSGVSGPIVTRSVEVADKIMRQGGRVATICPGWLVDGSVQVPF